MFIKEGLKIDGDFLNSDRQLIVGQLVVASVSMKASKHLLTFHVLCGKFMFLLTELFIDPNVDFHHCS